MKRTRSAGWAPDDSKADREAVGGIRFLQIPWLAWTLNLVFLPLEVMMFWGTWNPLRQSCFSLAALGYAVWIGVNGWIPWKMAMLRTLGGIDPERWERNPTAVAVAELLETPRVRWTAAAITSTAALTPWLVTAASAAASGKPFTDPNWLPPIGAAIFGWFDGLRAGTLAILWMIREIRRNWTRLREGPEPASAGAPREDALPGPPESAGEFLQRHGVSKSMAIFWFLTGLAVLGSLAYLRGCLRR